MRPNPSRRRPRCPDGYRDLQTRGGSYETSIWSSRRNVGQHGVRWRRCGMASCAGQTARLLHRRIEVTNPEGYARQYLPEAREIIKKHGGQLVAAGGVAGTGNPIIAIDGKSPKRVVIYRYPSIDAVHAWRNDPAYEQVQKLESNMPNTAPSPWWVSPSNLSNEGYSGNS